MALMEPENILNLSVRMSNYTEVLLGTVGLRFMQTALNNAVADRINKGEEFKEFAFEVVAILSDASNVLFLLYVSIDDNYFSITPINKPFSTYGAIHNAKAYLN